jgi:hypothetical protein
MLQRNAAAVARDNRKIDNYFFCVDFPKNSFTYTGMCRVINALPETVIFENIYEAGHSGFHAHCRHRNYRGAGSCYRIPARTLSQCRAEP